MDGLIVIADRESIVLLPRTTIAFLTIEAMGQTKTF